MLNNYFLSGFFKKPKLVWQRLSIVAYTYCLFTFAVAQVFASQGIKLKDEELDNVYAEGLSFNLDISLPKPQDLMNKAAVNTGTKAKNNLTMLPRGNSVNNNKGNNILMVGGSSQKYLSSLVNVNAAGSIVPVMLNLVISINSIITNLTNANKLNLENNYSIIPSPVAPGVNPEPALNIQPNAAVVPTVNIEPSNIQTALTTDSNVVPAVTAGMGPEPLLNNQSAVVSSSSSSLSTNDVVQPNTVVVPSADIWPSNVQPALDANNNVSPAIATNTEPEPLLSIQPTVASSSGLTQNSNSAIQPNEGVLPSVNIEPSNVQAVLSANNSVPLEIQPQVSAEVPVNSESVFTDNSAMEAVQVPSVNFEPLLSGNTGLNMVVVDAQSQQYLSSLVNVNAAGSVIPVLINLIISINSNIYNASNNNDIEMINNFRYQIN